MVAADELPSALQQGLADVITSLNLTGDDPAFAIAERVYQQQGPEPDLANVSSPGILIMPGDKETLAFQSYRGDTEHIYRQWTFRVLLIDKSGTRDHAQLPVYRQWRKQLMDALDQRRPIPTLKQAWCEVSPDKIVGRDPKKYPSINSAFVATFYTREARSKP